MNDVNKASAYFVSGRGEGKGERRGRGNGGEGEESGDGNEMDRKEWE